MKYSAGGQNSLEQSFSVAGDFVVDFDCDSFLLGSAKLFIQKYLTENFTEWKDVSNILVFFEFFSKIDEKGFKDYKEVTSQNSWNAFTKGNITKRQ